MVIPQAQGSKGCISSSAFGGLSNLVNKSDLSLFNNFEHPYVILLHQRWSRGYLMHKGYWKGRCDSEMKLKRLIYNKQWTIFREENLDSFLLLDTKQRKKCSSFIIEIINMLSVDIVVSRVLDASFCNMVILISETFWWMIDHV